MIQGSSPAARPVRFPYSCSTVQKLKWLQREVEHTAALAEYRGDLNTKLKALYQLGRLLWLESRLGRAVIDVTPDPAELLYQDHLKRLEDAQARRQAALASIPEESPNAWERYKRGL